MRCSNCDVVRSRGWFVGLACLASGAVSVATGLEPRWALAAGSIGPLAAVLAVTTRHDGSEALDEWAERAFNLDVPLRWWGIALALPLVLGTLAAVVATSRGAAFEGAAWQAAWGDEGWRLRTAGAAIAIGVVGEAAWRGWLFPHLRRTQGPLVSALMAWPAWGLWHLAWLAPMLPASLGSVVEIGFGLLCASVVLGWLVEATASAVPAMLATAGMVLAREVLAVALPAALPVLHALGAAVALAVIGWWWLVPRRAALALADRARTLAGHPTTILR